MQISDLREFIRLAQTLNFTQTANEFYMTQSVFSRHIARIERELGTRLFARSRHGVSLTSTGASFLVDAMRVVDDYDSALRNIDAIRSGSGEMLSIGYLYGASKPYLSQALEELHEAHPQLHVRLLSLELGSISQALTDNRIDLGITTANPEVAFPRDCYKTLELYDDPFMAIMPHDHHLAGKEQLTLADLEGEKIVIQPLNMGTSSSADVARMLRRFEDGSYLQDTQYDIASVQMLLLTGAYIAVTSGHVADLVGDGFVRRPLREAADIPFKVVAAWKPERDRPIVREFAQIMAGCVRRIREERPLPHP